MVERGTRHIVDTSGTEDEEKPRKGCDPTRKPRTDGESRAAVDVHDSDEEQLIQSEQVRCCHRGGRGRLLLYPHFPNIGLASCQTVDETLRYLLDEP